MYSAITVKLRKTIYLKASSVCLVLQHITPGTCTNFKSFKLDLCQYQSNVVYLILERTRF